jgi:hypothetical protein
MITQTRFPPFVYDLAYVADALAYMPRFRDIETPWYSVAQHAVMVSMHQENVGAALSVQFWGLHHEDAYAYKCVNDVTLGLTQKQIAETLNMHPTWPPPLSLDFHNVVVTAPEARRLALDLDPQFFQDIQPDERLPIAPLLAPRARDLYLARHNELLAAMEAAKQP